MRAILLIDFGSTYTKLTAVDIENAKILGTAASYTTVESDINEGLNKGLSILTDIRSSKDGYTRSWSQDS